MDTLKVGDRVSVRPSGIRGIVHALAGDVVYIRLDKGEIITALPGQEVDYLREEWCKYCGEYRQVKQRVADEVCLEVCQTCGNPIDYSAKEVETWQG